jgi:hypothetical protein
VALFNRVAELPLTIDACELESLAVELPREFVRRTTVVHLHGGEEEGVGEDVSYDAQLHADFEAEGPPPGLDGEWTLASFSAALPLLPGYRRWAVESAGVVISVLQRCVLL